MSACTIEDGCAAFFLRVLKYLDVHGHLHSPRGIISTPVDERTPPVLVKSPSCYWSTESRRKGNPYELVKDLVSGGILARAVVGTEPIGYMDATMSTIFNREVY